MLKLMAFPDEQIVLHSKDGTITLHLDVKPPYERVQVAIDAPLSVDIEREPRVELRPRAKAPAPRPGPAEQNFQITDGYELVMFGGNGQRYVLGNRHTPAPSRYTVHTGDGDVQIVAKRHGTKQVNFRVYAPTSARLARHRFEGDA